MNERASLLPFHGAVGNRETQLPPDTEANEQRACTAPPNIKLTGPAASVSLEVSESHAAAGPVQRPVRHL